MTTITRNETAIGRSDRHWSRKMLNKVPEVTLYFWVIKILCRSAVAIVWRSGSSRSPATVAAGSAPARRTSARRRATSSSK